MRPSIGLLLGLGLITPAIADILVVGNKAEDTVGFIDLEKGEMIATRQTGHGPHEVAIAPDGRRAAVVAYGTGPQPGDSIHLYDTATASFLGKIDLGRFTRPHGIVWHPDGADLLVTTEGSGHLLLIDAGTGAIGRAIETGAHGSHMLALSPDGGRAFVANLGSDSVSVIDIVAGSRVAIIETGRESEGIAITPDGREVWVGNRGEDKVMVFDSVSLERLAVISTGTMPIRVAISPDGRTAVTSNARAGTLSIIDTASKKVVKTVSVKAGEKETPLPVTLLFRPDGGALYVSLTNLNSVAVFDPADWSLKARIKAGSGSDGLGYSPLAPELGE